MPSRTAPTPSTTAYAAWIGLGRGWIEFRHNLTSPRDQAFNLMAVGGLVGAVAFQQGRVVDGVPLSAMTLASSLGLVVVLGGVPGIGGQLAAEREDSTLLRTRAVPYGMVGLLTGRLVTVLLDVMFTMVLVLAAGLVVLAATGSISSIELRDGATLLWLIPLGLLATAPVGAVVGSMLRQVRNVGASTMLGVLTVSGISGVFYPITQFPGWVQDVAQVFPLYWLGLGMRSAFLPDSASVVEVDESWRTAETVGVLGAWAIAGLVIAALVLRRTVRRQSGMDLDTRQRKAMQRI